MNKQELSTAEERKIKMAQIGILVATVLAVALFVGIRISTTPASETHVTTAVEPAASPISEPISESMTVVETAPAPAEEPVEAEVQTTPSVTEAPAVSVAPREPVTYAEAEQVFRTGDYEEAAALFSAYVEDHGANAWGHYMLGLAESRAGNPDAAEDAFLHALELKPDHLKSLVNYARVLIILERNEEARNHLEAALAVNPASTEASRVLGRVQHNLGQLTEAEETYRSILQAREDDVWSLNNLGLVLIQQERFREALSPLARAAGLNDAEACIQNNLGIALENSGYEGAAGQAYARALICEAEYAKALENLARVEGRVDGADLPTLDLAVLAAEFTARPVAEALARSDEDTPAGEAVEVDMEVASTLDSSNATTDKPEQGSRNR